MTEQKRTENNQKKLQELNPFFRVRVLRTLNDLERNGFRPRIQSAWRSPADQLKAFNGGFSKLRWGFHNATTASGGPDALAADILDDDNPLDPPLKYLYALAFFAMANGLSSGIFFGLPKSFFGRLHFAIADWSHPDPSARRGWDAVHVEISGISVRDAKSGKRPTS